jgi:hypothetical protein
MSAPYGFRFYRFGTAMVLLTMPVTLPVFMLAGALLEAFNIAVDTLRNVPFAVRYVVRGRP